MKSSKKGKGYHKINMEKTKSKLMKTDAGNVRNVKLIKFLFFIIFFVEITCAS